MSTWNCAPCVLGALALGACVEWFEVDDASPATALEASAPEQPLYGAEASLPGVAPRVGAAGPLVPQSPGLRVPDGYWSRVRLDEADLLLPHTWASLERAGYSAGGEPRGTLLRIQSHQDAELSKGEPSPRAVIRIAIVLIRICILIVSTRSRFRVDNACVIQITDYVV